MSLVIFIVYIVHTMEVKQCKFSIIENISFGLAGILMKRNTSIVSIGSAQDVYMLGGLEVLGVLTWA